MFDVQADTMAVPLFSFFGNVSCYSGTFESRKNALMCGKTGAYFGRTLNTCGGKDAVYTNLIPRRLEGSYFEKQSEKENKRVEFLRTLLIDNYDSYTYNIYQELSIVNGVPPVVLRNDGLSWDNLCRLLYEERAFDNIVISPGPGSPRCPEDVGICLMVLRECEDIPILGICLGHQALGYVHGANIVHAHEPVHGRLSHIVHNGDKLFRFIPSGRNSDFNVVRYHSLVVDAISLPRELIPIAWTSSNVILPFLPAKESYFVAVRQENSVHSHPLFRAEGMKGRALLMGIMHCSRPHYGLQFHPESVATCYGRQIFQNFRDITINYLHTSRSDSKPMDCQTDEMNEGFIKDACGTKPQGIKFNGSVERSYFSIYNIVRDACGGSYTKLKLTWRKYDSLAANVGGAARIFCDLFENHNSQNAFWLDSSSTEKNGARFSFMGVEGGLLWKRITFSISNESESGGKSGGYISIEVSDGSVEKRFLETGFFSFLDQELQSFHFSKSDYEGLPFDFYGGYVGYIGYNLKSECGAVRNVHKSKTPDACFFFVDNLVVIDHLFDDVYLLSLHGESVSDTSWLDCAERKLMGLNVSKSVNCSSPPSMMVNIHPSEVGFVLDKSRDEYVKDVGRCLNLIRDGESYELCLTTQLRKDIGDVDSLGLYLKIREDNPAPYAAWLNFPNQNLSIFCSSPERFLKLDRRGNLEAKPIKGTVSRGATTEEDQHYKTLLQYSEKDRAENLMIVDLLRNDLGQVCEPGSVHVPHLMEVESYATVHTMVSTIRGKKRCDVSAIDCVRAAFPGGSMTGAPKLRSMALLDGIERCSRGVYSGCIGYFSFNSSFDLNIVIRTVVLHEGEASIGAGGAIVALSNPEKEYEEMILKTRAPVLAVMKCSTGHQ